MRSVCEARCGSVFTVVLPDDADADPDAADADPDAAAADTTDAGATTSWVFLGARFLTGASFFTLGAAAGEPAGAREAIIPLPMVPLEAA